MPSLQARLFKFMLQNRHLLSFHLKKETIDWNTYEAIVRFRQEVEDGAARFGKLPDGIKVSPLNIGDISAEWILPEQSTKERIILYFHGGGYVSGTCRSHRSIVAKFVKGSETGALLFEYRLAPEHPYPAALDDAVTVYEWLLSQNILPSRIVFVGDSAGGGLSLATLLALRDRGIPLPAAAVSYSPVTDLRCTGESYRTKAKVCLSPEGMAAAIAKHYAGDKDPGLPYISPLYGNLHGLPPLLIYVGEEETLLDDSTGQGCGCGCNLKSWGGPVSLFPSHESPFPGG